MKEGEPNSANYNIANFEADQVVDEYVSELISRHIACNCHSCKLRAKQLSEDFMLGIDPSDIAQWHNEGIEGF